MVQDKLIEEKDEFVESLNLTPEKIKEDFESVKSIEGFPKGEDEDILDLSNPPYYTAYPNPYIKDFIEYYGTPYDEETDDYNVEPFVGDVSEGKNDPVYRAHSYHTKVPPKAIEKFIDHYTKQGDIVFDGFCGSGMTGISSQKLGVYPILNDLEPAATFISYNYNNLIQKNLLYLFNEWKKEYESYYYTKHSNDKRGIINYVVWSDVFLCPFCGKEVVFWEVSLSEDKNKIFDKFPCPHCNSELSKNSLKRVFIRKFDNNLNKEVKIQKQKPVRIYYKYKNKNYFKNPDEEDINLIEFFENMNMTYWVPLNEIIDGDAQRAKKSHGVYFLNQVYKKRTLFVLSYLFDKINKMNDSAEKYFLKWVFTSINPRLTSKFARYRPGRGKGDMISGILYMSSLQAEANVFKSFESKLKSLSKLSINPSKSIISTQSSTDLKNIPKNSIDYIFIDPPFGANLMYSELNYVWESWLKVFTNDKNEAIISKEQSKSSKDYENLLGECFKEFYRILKPNRWITIEFHNSQAEIWNIIQKSIVRSGFIIAQVAILDKKQGSFKQVTMPGAVKNDLIINAYKPIESFSELFIKQGGFNLEKDFLDMHLNKLPIKPNIERTSQPLYSNYLAQYVQNNFEVKLGYSDFKQFLYDNYESINGYWFTLEQMKNIKDTKLNAFKNDGLNNNILGIIDEKTAIIWLSQFLNEPKYYHEIHENYLKSLMTSQDKIPELKIILDENFIYEEKKYRLPTSNEQFNIEEKRNKQLQKDFEGLLEKINSSKKKIKEVRKEALLYGLMNLYKEKEVDLIKTIGNRVDRNIINSDDDISTIIDWAMYK